MSLLKRLVRIARWETTRSAGTLDKRTAIVLVLAILVGITAGGVAVATDQASLDEDIYRVAVDEEHPYYAVVAEAKTLRPVDPEKEITLGEDADLIVKEGRNIAAARNQKGGAALSALRDAIERYNNRELRKASTTEREEVAAFPVRVELRFESRTTPGTSTSLTSRGSDTTGGDGTNGGTADDTGETDTGAGGSDSGTAGDGGDDNTGGDRTDSGDSDGESTDDDGTDTGTQEDDDGQGDGSTDASTADSSDGDGGFSLPSLSDSGFFGGSQEGTPAEIQPPFPFQSLLLAFLFIVPMNFVIQAYGGTIMNERLNRRGELLLVTPASAGEIVGGKTLPYFVGLFGFTVVVTALVEGGILSIAAVLPLALLFLAATFVGGMFARSFKELTFVTVSISVFLTTYAFVPAIFTEVTPIALISPLTLVVMDLEGSSVSIAEYVFSTGAVYCSSFVLFGLGLSVYREEDMFTQRPIHLKTLDAFGIHVRKYRHVAVFSAVLIPFVFLVQLLSLAVLFPLPIKVGVVVLLVVVSCVEELAKSIHVFAAFEHDRFDRTNAVAVSLGIASGIGFFIAEKAAHLGQLVELQEIELATVFQHSFAETGSLLLSAGLFFVPVVLHSGTAIVSAVGARRGSRQYVVALLLAILLHTVYNLGVISLVA